MLSNFVSISQPCYPTFLFPKDFLLNWSWTGANSIVQATFENIYTFSRWMRLVFFNWEIWLRHLQRRWDRVISSNWACPVPFQPCFRFCKPLLSIHTTVISEYPFWFISFVGDVSHPRSVIRLTNAKYYVSEIWNSSNSLLFTIVLSRQNCTWWWPLWPTEENLFSIDFSRWSHYFGPSLWNYGNRFVAEFSFQFSLGCHGYH